jgi:cell division protease FtsH
MVIFMAVAQVASLPAAYPASAQTRRILRQARCRFHSRPISYGPEGPSRDNPFAGRPYAEETQRSIDQEVARLLRDAEDTATKLLLDHRQTLDRVIDLLLERETIDGSDLAAIVGASGAADHEPDGAPLALTMTAIPGGQRRDQRGQQG